MAFRDERMMGLDWKTYLKRMRRAFGDDDLADAYDLGYEDGIRDNPKKDEFAKGSPEGIHWAGYLQGYEDGQEDRNNERPSYGPVS